MPESLLNYGRSQLSGNSRTAVLWMIGIRPLQTWRLVTYQTGIWA